MHWKEWYFARLLTPPSPNRDKFVWDALGRGTVLRNLSRVADKVFGVSNAHKVDWTKARSTHLYLRGARPADAMATLNASFRLCKFKVAPPTNRWYLNKIKPIKSRATKDLVVTSEESFEEIVADIRETYAEDAAAGVIAAANLIYYCGIATPKVRSLRYFDLLRQGDKTFVYDTQRLIEIPEHVVEALNDWTRRHRARSESSPLFTAEQKRAIGRYTNLHDTNRSLRRIRA